jgi:hypothetical protein
VHAAQTLKKAGFETIMVNCNPETVSTDYDTSDRLYFEPLTLEDVLEIVYAEQLSGNVLGVIVQLGGQTPLGLAQKLKDNGVPIVGTSPEAIHLAEERGAFGKVLEKAKLISPDHGMAASFPEVNRYTRVGPSVPVLPATSKDLAEHTFAAMTDIMGNRIYDIVAQGGHGVCAVAGDPWAAYEHIERLEHICEIVLKSGVRPNNRETS